jgi:hypothetical protein
MGVWLRAGGVSSNTSKSNLKNDRVNDTSEGRTAYTVGMKQISEEEGKTVHVVFKYLSGSLMYGKRWGLA